MSERAETWKRAAYAGVAGGILFAAIAGSLTAVIQHVAHRPDVLPFGGLIATSAASGAIFGVLIGLFFGLFMNSRMVARQTSIELPAGEVVEYQGGANHFLNYEARGGRLYLTNHNLIFKPHSLNLQNAPVVIARSDITGTEKCMTLGVVPNGLLVEQRGGTKSRFVVPHRGEWMRRLAA